MFGHDDQSQHHQDDNQPVPDEALTDDNQGAVTPVDDTAGDFIDDAPSGASQGQDNSIGLPATPAPGNKPGTDHLLDIKQQALQQLTPLIGHLDQAPEEKFRTTMMMIQASDNDSLIKEAYEAALKISDEKARAQALLDVVNEINYFTHSDNNNQ